MKRICSCSFLIFVLALCSLPAQAQPAGSTGLLVGLGNKCLDVFDSGTATGTPVVLYECHGNANQQWEFVAAGAFLELRGIGSRCLQPGGIGSTGLEEMITGPCGGGEDRWLVDGSFPSDFRLVHVDSGDCLDVYDNMTGDGTPIALFECHGNANQDWRLSGTALPGALPALILPGFVVDKSDPFGLTTLFSVRNSSNSSVTVRYTYFDAVGNVRRIEDRTLAAQAVRPVNLDDVSGLTVGPGTFARGYVGMTVIEPSTGQPAATQPIHGDWFRAEPNSDFASGDRLLATTDTNAGTALCRTWETRFLEGGAFDGGTLFSFFLPGNSGASEPAAVGQVYSESGSWLQTVTLNNTSDVFEETSNGYGFDSTAGTVVWTFREGLKGHVGALFRAENRFSVGLSATCITP